MTDPSPDPFSDTRRAEETFRLQPAPDWVERAEIPWDTPAAPDDHVVALLVHTQWAPEKSLRHERSVRRFVSREAVQKLSQVELEWDPEIENLIIHDLGIWRQGVKRDLTERSRFLLRQREGAFEQQLVHGRMSALVLLDDVRPGDVVELEFSILSQARLPGEKFDAIYSSERSMTTGRWIVSILLPDGSTFEWRGSSPEIRMEESRSAASGDRVLTFSGKQETPLELEGGIPPWLIPYQHFQVSGYRSWEEVSTCIAEAWASVPRDHEALRLFAEEISGEGSTPEAKARLLVDWVQEHVRYLGMVGGAGGLRPQSPNLVLERRYGDCKDKSLLLCSLLNAIGVAAEPVLVNTVHRHLVGSVLPAMGAFDHVIATLEIDGRRGFVDATIAGDGGGLFDRCLLPYGLGLPVRAGTNELIPIPERGPDLTSLLVTEDIHFDHTSLFSYIDWRIEAVGGDANLLRARLRAVGGEAFAKAEAEDLRQTFSTARHVGPAKWIDDPLVNRVIVWGRAAFADWGINPTGGRKTFQYKPRWIYHALTAPTIAEKRRFPFQLVFPANVRHEIRVHQKRHGFSQTFRVKSDNRFFQTCTSIRRASDEMIEAVYAYRVRAGILNPDQVNEYWKHLDQTVSNQLGLTLSLRGKATANRSLPENFEKTIPARDEEGLAMPRVDLSAAVNIQDWIEKPAQGKPALREQLPGWAIAVITIAILGFVGNLIEKCSPAQPAKTRTDFRLPSSIPSPQAVPNYVNWEDGFESQENLGSTAIKLGNSSFPSRSDENTYLAALNAYLEGDLVTAARHLDGIPPRSQSFNQATVLRGLMALDEGDTVKASNIAKHAVSNTPDDPMAWLLAAEVAMFLDGNEEQAIQSIRKAVALDPENFLLHVSLVSLLERTSDQKAAFEAASHGEVAFPESDYFTSWIANHLDRTGRTTEAVAKARLAVDSPGGSPKSRIVLARLLAKSTEPADQSESRKIRTDLIRGAGDDPDQIRDLVDAAESAGDTAMAHELLAHAALKCPRADLLADLALVRMEEGKFDEARLHLETALRLDPKSSKAMEVRWILEGENLDESIRGWAKEALAK